MSAVIYCFLWFTVVISYYLGKYEGRMEERRKNAKK